MTRRSALLFLCVALSALPLVWLSLDSNAGEKLLKVTKAPNTAKR